MKTGRRKLSSRRVLALATVALSLCASAAGAPRYQVLHDFNGSDGSGPYGGVTLDKRGNIYGTTAGGGPCGTVLELSPGRGGQWTETILYQFAASSDGCDPWSKVTFGETGNLYGTTVGGGAYYYGTVFELTPGSGGWTESILYSFGTQSDDGGKPTDGLVMDNAGNLYGTAPNGGTYNAGTVFELMPGSGVWNETVLYPFCPSSGCSDGHTPTAGLTLDLSGNL